MSRCQADGDWPADGTTFLMNGSPLLERLLAALAQKKLETVLIGNAAASILGAPFTTPDFDFMFRDTPTTMRKLKGVAAILDAVILRPFYPVSKLSRMVDDSFGQASSASDSPARSARAVARGLWWRSRASGVCCRGWGRSFQCSARGVTAMFG